MESVLLHTCFLLSICVISLNYIGAVTQTGKVYVGTPGNLSTSLSFSDAESQGAVQVFIQVEVTDGGTTTLADINSNVTVSCSFSPELLGYSQVIFTSVDVEAPNISAPNFTTEPVVVQIPFSIIAAGRSVELRCWGDSILNPGENETQGNSTSPQFTKERSMSPAVIFTIRRRGSVNICYDIVVVPNKESDNKGEFLVELSEPVEINTNVSITCDVQIADPSNPSDAMQLNIQPALMMENALKVTISYERIRGKGALSVSCKGQSVYVIGNDTFDGDQFKNSTSRGEPVSFVLDAGHVTLYPGTNTILQTSEMRLFLVLDAGVTSDVSFTCRAEAANTTEMAAVIANDPFCETITQEVVNRPVSNVSVPAGNPGARGTTPAPDTTSSGLGNETNHGNETSTTQGPRTTTSGISNSENLPEIRDSFLVTGTISDTSGTTTLSNPTSETVGVTSDTPSISTNTDSQSSSVAGWTSSVDLFNVGTTSEDIPDFVTNNPNATDLPLNSSTGFETTTEAMEISTLEPVLTTEEPSICYTFQQITVNETVIIETLVNGSLVNMTIQQSRTENITKAVNCSEITTQAPTTSPRNRTIGEWQIRNPTVDFKEGSPPYQMLILERNNIPTTPVEEFVIVTCCAPGGSNKNPKYKEKSSAVLIAASLTPNVTVNWTDATVPEKDTEERVIQNPAYVEVAPCPCDLTKESCDPGCCCDKDCTDADKEVFECIPGIAGGFPPPLPQYSCASTYTIRDDWFPFMCVHAENTAFLGYYFFPLPATRNQVDFNGKAQGKKPKYTYKGADKRSQFATVQSVGYRNGDNLRTGQIEKSVADNVITRDSFQLSVPQKSLLGECVTMSPIRYQQDIDTKCSHSIISELCHSKSALSASMYAQSTSQTHPPCPKAHVILKTKGKKEIVEVATNFLCISDPTTYLKSTSYYSDFVKPKQKSLFSNIDFDTSRCDFDPTTNAYICQSNSEGNILAYNLTRCSWDDSYTNPPVPTFNETADTCQNAVIDIHYNFTWKGGEILMLNATYILADLPTELERVDSYPVVYTDSNVLSDSDAATTSAPTSTVLPTNTTSTLASESTTPPGVNTTVPDNMDNDLVDSFSTVDVTITKFPAVLSQKIRVVFWHEYTLPNITQDPETETEPRVDRYQRSGRMGYENDLPVFSGVPVYNQTTGDFSHIDIDDKSRLSLWKPGPSGLCADAGRQTVEFGQDAVSSCSLRLGLTELHQNCNGLRKQILHHQDALMRSSYISTNGDPSITNLQQWLQIIRENISSILPPEEIAMTTASMTTGEETTTQQMTTAQSTSADVNATTETLTTQSPNITTTVETNPDQGEILTKTIGKCLNIPSGIHVDIMYAQSGAVNSIPLYEIVGAKISYALSEWQLTCMGAQGQACLGNMSETANSTEEETVQTFYLSSSVRFILVPSQQPVAKTKYQLKNEERDSICKGDACWEELFYPVLSLFQGDAIQYTRAVVMTSSIFILSYFFVTKPWW